MISTKDLKYQTEMNPMNEVNNPYAAKGDDSKRETGLTITPKKSIYNIQGDYLRLMAEIESNDGELTEDTEARLTINRDELEDKCVNYGYVIRQYDFEIGQLQNEIERLGKIAAKKEKIKFGLKIRISDAMLGFNVTKVQKNNLTLSFRKSSVLVVEKDAHIPVEYISTKEVETIDNKALKEAILAGAEYEGIFIHENQNLQIR